jgi:hypothetical protein
VAGSRYCDRDSRAVPVNEVEIYLALGWSLTETVRPLMVPPICFLSEALEEGVSRESERPAP